MSEIESVALIGAGALGLLYMDSIQKTFGEKSYFLAEENRFFSLKNKKFTINSKQCDFNISSVDTIKNSPDLIIVCVKNHHLQAISSTIKKVAGSDTIILSVLNGIDSENYLQQLLPDSTVLYCAVLGMDAVKEKDSLSFTRKGKFLMGSMGNKKSSSLIKTCNFLKRSHLDFEIPEDIHREIWYKWMINIGVNQVSAITGATYGIFQKDRILQNLMENAMRETIEVAKAEKVNLCEDDLERWYKVLNTLGAEGKTSMLQDMEAMRITEVESFAGELIKRAVKHSIKVPVNDTLYRLIKTKESLYAK